MSKIIEYAELKQFHRRVLGQLNNFTDHKHIEFLDGSYACVPEKDFPAIQIVPTVCVHAEETKHLYKLIANVLKLPEINRIIHEQVKQILTEQLEKARLEAQKEIKEILGEELKI